MNFRWYGAEFKEFVTNGTSKALGSAGILGKSVWEYTAPISTDPRTTGDLRASWFSSVDSVADQIILTVGSSARYAIYVEFGTSRSTARAPLRKTVGYVTAVIPQYLRNELVP